MTPEVEELCRQLQIKASGAHVHTANKAAMYLRRFSEKAVEIADGSLDKFVTLIRGAVYRGEWKALDEKMARWW